MELSERKNVVEYKFLRQNIPHEVSKLRYSLVAYLGVFQVAFIILVGVFGSYAEDGTGKYSGSYSDVNKVPTLYAMFQDVHTMMFIGFGFLMTFLKRYGYSSVGINMLIAVYVIEWSLLVRGWLEQGVETGGYFKISLLNLLVSDFCAAAVLISFGAVLGKTSPSQLIVMATIEVVAQSVNEHIGLHYLKAYDVGESMYVHAFGAYFGLVVAKILHHKTVESDKESASYQSDLFSMIGTLFLWLFWPSFNSAVAVDEGQSRAIINTVLSIAASCITTFIISTIVGKGRLNMVHIQNATLAGGVAVGTIADMNIRPFGAMIIGSVAGVISTLGFQYLTPLLKKIYLHDTCGVNNLHGMPGLLSGIIGAIVAAVATRDEYNGDNLYKFYPSRIPAANSTEYIELSLFNSTNSDLQSGGDGRSAGVQAAFQLAGLGVTLAIAVVSGIVAGFVMKLPIVEQIKEEEELFDDQPLWETPEDFSVKLTEISEPKGQSNV